jgi:hypothetical protein
MAQLAILARLGKAETRYPADDVEAFFAEDRYVLARLISGMDVFVDGLVDKNGSVETSKYLSIKYITQWLDDHGASQFIRAERSWIANMNHVKTYRSPARDGAGSMLTTYSGAIIPSSRRMNSTVRFIWRNGTGKAASLLLGAALLAHTSPSPAAEIRYTDEFTPTEFCRALGESLNADASADRILCDCEPGNSMCFAWDAQGAVIGQERERDHQLAKPVASPEKTI